MNMKIYEGRLGVVEEIQRRQRVTYVCGDDKYQKRKNGIRILKAKYLSSCYFRGMLTREK